MQNQDTKGYPLFFFRMSRYNQRTLLLTTLGVVLAIAAYVVYSRISNDVAPDSVAGYTFAIAGTSFMLLASLKYSLYRRSRKHGIGQLNGALNWHMSFGIIAIVLLFLHAFGNFNPRTGTYALYGMIALVISGVIGKIFDRVMPRLIAAQVSKAITEQGEDRIESISQQLEQIVVHNTQQLRGFSAGQTSSAGLPFTSTGAKAAVNKRGKETLALQTPWDLSYLSIDDTPQELNQQAVHYRFVPDRKSELSRTQTYLPGAEEQLAALQSVQRALQLEQCYRYVIRYWRVFHIFLALLTVGLTIWHLIYAAQLLIPTLGK